MFTQVDRTLEQAQGGLGIGLTLVKRLAQMHDGMVEARSAGHGQGSEFIVRLSAVDLPALPRLPPAAGQDPSTGALPRHRILVADDNEDSAASLGSMLRLMGHDVEIVHDGLAAVEAVRSYQPDVVLLDIGMPKLNGYEAAGRIRGLPGGHDPVLVAVTGWGQEDDRRRSQDAGFDHHMVKPADPAALAKLLCDIKPKQIR
jgi:CheY-like chemotaxis protein